MGDLLTEATDAFGARDFVAGGVVPLGSVAYVARAFESECLKHVSAGHWVTLLGPRQHGKSSGLLRLRQELEENGFRVALVDLQNYSTRTNPDVQLFYKWFVTQSRRRLGLGAADLSTVTDDLESALELVVADLGQSRLVVIIDEATSLHDGTRLTLFSQLRALHTAGRGGMSAVADRLQFVFAGTFRPDTVIDDDNSPFNVSRVVITDDLSEDAVRALAAGVVGGDDMDSWSVRAYEEVGGQPYLVQRLLEAVSQGSIEDSGRLFSSALGSLESGSDGHLPALLRRLAAEPGADELLHEIVSSGAAGLATSGTGLAHFLQIVGAARLEDEYGVLRLRIRNALYQRAFEASAKISPEAALQESSGVETAPLIIVPVQVGDLAWIQDESLRTVVADCHASAVTLASDGHYRMALTALGSAYEGMLIAFLEQMVGSDRSQLQARARRPNGSRITGSIRDWKFEALVCVAHESSALFDVSRANSDLVRDWRNYVHPEKARASVRDEAQLRPEVRVVDAYVEKLLQAMNHPTPLTPV